MSGEGRSATGASPPAGSSGRAPGTIVGRRYRLETVIGEGGMGVVHRATDQIMRRTVAIKEVRMPFGSPEANAEGRERVLREARSAGRIHHPGAVGVLDVIDDGELPWIVMELVEGEPLSARIEREGGLPIDQVAQIGISLAYALDAAHRLGVVHRDVKPSNVLLTSEGQARLTDFGIAVSDGDPRLTRTGEVVGSPAYLAPERAHGEPGGPECDVWGLGATLYAAVEGEPPFGGATPLDVLTSVVDGLIRPARHAGRLGPVLDAMLSQREIDRPTLTNVRTRLRDLAGEIPGKPTTTARLRAVTRPGVAPAVGRPTGVPGQPASPVRPGPGRARPVLPPPATAPPAPPAPRPATAAQPVAAAPAEPVKAGAEPVEPGPAHAAAAVPPAGPTRVLDEVPFSPPDDVVDAVPARDDPAAVGDTAPADAMGNAVPAADETAEGPEGPAGTPVPTTVIMGVEPPGVAAPSAPAATPAPAAGAARSAGASPGAGAGGTGPTTTFVGREGVGQPTPDLTQVLGAADEADDAAPNGLTDYWAAGSAWAGRRVPATDDTPAQSGNDRVEDPPRPPRPRRPSEIQPPRSQAERRVMIILAVLVVVLALALLVVRLSSSDHRGNDTRIGDQGSAHPAAATADLAAIMPAATDGPLATGSAPASPPAGWVSYHDAAGWSIAYPSSWRRQAGLGGPGTVDFTDPAAGTVLRVGGAGQAPASILRDWLANFETASHSGPMSRVGYQRLRLEPADGGDGSTEADWEYTYSKDGGTIHVLVRGANRGGHGYLLSWQTEEELWTGDEALRRQLFAAFRPAP